MPSAPCSVRPDRIALTSSRASAGVVEDVEPELAVAERVEQLVDVVRAGLVAHLDERERELRLRRPQHDRVEHLRMRDAHATSRRTSAAA